VSQVRVQLSSILVRCSVDPDLGPDASGAGDAARFCGSASDSILEGSSNALHLVDKAVLLDLVSDDGKLAEAELRVAESVRGLSMGLLGEEASHLGPLSECDVVGITALVLPEAFAGCTAASASLINDQSCFRVTSKGSKLGKEVLTCSIAALEVSWLNNDRCNWLSVLMLCFESRSDFVEDLAFFSGGGWVSDRRPAEGERHAWVSELGQDERVTVVGSFEAQS
jgi:hypothetical protein